METILAFGGAFAAAAIGLLVATVFVVKQQTAAVIERFGKFVRVSGPGLNFKLPFVERVVGRPSLRVQQLDVEVETKTLDDVFVRVVVSVQYFVIPEAVFQAFYRLDDASAQIRSFVFDVVRARVPNIQIDDVFKKKDDIADAVKNELSLMMGDFGYGIVKALVTDIEPDARVKTAMNEINAAQRMRIAATEKDIGATSATNTILMPHSPGAMADLGSQLRDAMITSQAVDRARADYDHGNNGAHYNG